MLYEFVHPNKRLEDVSFYDLLPDESLDLHDFHLHEFFKFMFERQEIWYKRNMLRQSAPWTDDVLLRDYSFTNVYRCLDRSSQFLIKNVISNKKLTLTDIVFRIMIYRYFNKPDAFEDGYIDLPEYDTFNPQWLHEKVINCRKRYYNPWHTAYMSNLVWAKKEPYQGEMFKDHAYCIQLFPIFHKVALEIATEITCRNCDPVKLMKWLNKLPSISDFISHELYLDFCYISKYNSNFRIHFDENSYTNVGPGASLGIKLIFPSTPPEKQKDAIYLLRDISEMMLGEIGKFKYIEWVKSMQRHELCEHNITLHQIEFVLCEYSKYRKMKWGRGKQRSKFLPHSLS